MGTPLSLWPPLCRDRRGQTCPSAASRKRVGLWGTCHCCGVSSSRRLQTQGAGGSPTGRAAQDCVAVVTGNWSCCPRNAACLPLRPPVPPWLFRSLSLAVLQGEDPEPVVSLEQSPLCERLCQWPRTGLLFQKPCVVSMPGPCPQVPWVLLRLWVSPPGPTLRAEAEAAAPELGAEKPFSVVGPGLSRRAAGLPCLLSCAPAGRTLLTSLTRLVWARTQV